MNNKVFVVFVAAIFVFYYYILMHTLLVVLIYEIEVHLIFLTFEIVSVLILTSCHGSWRA
jgi:hypothetical protein